jgi:hypothetical protein
VFQSDLRVGAQISVSSKITDFSKNIYLPFFRTVWLFYASRLGKRGVRPIVTKRGAGCGGRDRPVRRARRERTAKSCGPDAPGLASSLQVTSLRTTVTQRSGHRGEHEAALTPSCRECRCFGFACGKLLVCFLHSHTRLRVQLNTRHSLHPLFFSGWSTQDSDEIRRGSAKVCLPHGRGPSFETPAFILPRSQRPRQRSACSGARAPQDEDEKVTRSQTLMVVIPGRRQAASQE